MAVETPPVNEVPRTLAEAPPPRLLGLWDQTALWANLGISLLLLVAAAFVLQPDPSLPPLSLAAGLVAIVVGAVVGNAWLALAAAPGADTGAPAMVLVRGLLGRRGSWAPTVLNVAQNLGWAWVEIVVIAESAARLTRPSLRPWWVLAAGVLGTLMAIRPLGVVRGFLKKVAVWAIIASTAYLLFEVMRHAHPGFAHGSWSAFWKGADLVIALPISWAPLAADYSRHSRSARAAFGGAFIGYGAATIAFFVLGLLATAADPKGDAIASVLAIPVGSVALLILVLDELDEVFANIYSTVVSIQNIGPRIDRRVMAVVVGAVSTVLALRFHNWQYYENFLLLIGSVFVPLFATFIVDYYVFHRGRWDVSENARPRWEMLVPWAAGFVAYQLINPGFVGWWSRWWIARQQNLHFTPPTWTSASLISFAVAGVLAFAIGRVRARNA